MQNIVQCSCFQRVHQCLVYYPISTKIIVNEGFSVNNLDLHLSCKMPRAYFPSLMLLCSFFCSPMLSYSLFFRFCYILLCEHMHTFMLHVPKVSQTLFLLVEVSQTHIMYRCIAVHVKFDSHW